MASEEKTELRCEEAVREIIVSFAFLRRRRRAWIRAFDFASFPVSSFFSVEFVREKEGMEWKARKEQTHTPARWEGKERKDWVLLMTEIRVECN